MDWCRLLYDEDEDVGTSQSLLLSLVESLLLMSYISLDLSIGGRCFGEVLARVSLWDLVCGSSSLVVTFVCVCIALSRKALDIFDLHSS